MLNSLIPWLSFGLNVLVLIVSIAGFLKIIKNDLTHVQKALEKLTDKVDEIDKKLDLEAEEVAKIKGKCQERTRC